METFYKVMHQWCVPLFHMLLWIASLILTTEFPGLSSLPTTKEPWSIIIIFTTFFFEIAMSLFDTAIAHKTKVINIKILIFLTPFVAIIALTNAAAIIYCSNTWQLQTICALIFFSASVKGMNAWLQNNIDKFTISITQGNGIYSPSFTLNNAATA